MQGIKQMAVNGELLQIALQNTQYEMQNIGP